MSKTRAYILMAAISLLLAIIALVQFRWIAEVSAAELRERQLRVHQALQSLVQHLPGSTECVELFTKYPLQPGEGFYLLKQYHDGTDFTGRADTIAMYYDYATFQKEDYTGEVPYRYSSIKASIPITVDITATLSFEPDGSTAFNRFSHDMKDINRDNFKSIIAGSKRIEEYLDISMLDSQIAAKLAQAHVSGAYGFGFILNGRVVYARRVDDSSALLQSPYVQPLFEANRFMQPYQLSLLPAPQQGLPMNLWLALGVVALLLLLGSFYALMRVYFDQQRLSKMKSDFINNLTHEFNTPMANISLAVQTMQTVDIDREKLGKVTGIISTESQRLQENIERVLQVAKLDKGTILLRTDEIDLVDLVTTIEPTYQLHCRELGGQLLTEYKVANAIITGDEMHLLNTLCNLLDNAIKYRDGIPVIHINVSARSKWHVVEVSDNGKGMDAKTQKYIFEKFYRAHEGYVHSTKGFGIGLSYVKSIVEAHGGKITVFSKPGRGTTFTILLPKKDE